MRFNRFFPALYFFCAEDEKLQRMFVNVGHTLMYSLHFGDVPERKMSLRRSEATEAIPKLIEKEDCFVPTKASGLTMTFPISLKTSSLLLR
jgi:hypothetical protein